MHADLSIEKREALVGVFQGSRKADSTVGQGHPFRVLVGSSRLLGQGVTLNKANRLVLMEPGWHAGVKSGSSSTSSRNVDRCSTQRAECSGLFQVPIVEGERTPRSRGRSESSNRYPERPSHRSRRVKRRDIYTWNEHGIRTLISPHRTVVHTVGVMESTQVLTCIVPLDLNYLQPVIFLTSNWLRRSLLR
jgi:hypothetical protein